MTFYNHIESVRGLAIDLTNGRKWRGASDKAAVFDALDAARREYMRLSDENAKLRKLLLDVWNDAMQFDGFWDYVNDDGEIYNEDELPHYYDRMRELGLEVK